MVLKRHPGAALALLVLVLVSAASAQTTWNGLTWSAGAPTGSTNAVVAGNYTVGVHDGGADFVCVNLTINAGDTLTVMPGKNLTAFGTTTVNGVLAVQSTAAGDGSYVGVGTVTGGVKVARYLAAGRWHLVSPSIQAARSGDLTGIYLRPYDEAADAFGAYITVTTQGLPAGSGYVAWAAAGATVTYTGNVNSGTISPAVSWAGDINHGYNLVGNPYPCAIDWNSTTGWTRTNVEGTIWVWNPAVGNYGTWDGAIATNGASRYIAMGQGFFVHVLAAGAVFSMDNRVRLHDATGFLKAQAPGDVLRLAVSGSSTYRDECLVRFDAAATTGYDINLDAAKLQGDSAAPQLYTLADGRKYAVNALPLPTNGLEVPLNLEPGTADAQYTLTIGGALVSNGVQAFVRDNLASQLIDPATAPSYQFTASAGQAAGRFTLVYGAPNGVMGQARGRTSAAVLTLRHEGLSVLAGSEAAVVRVFGADGRLVDCRAVAAGATAMLRLPSALRVGVVSISVDGRETSTRRFVQP
jgi:hypothetical protein